MDIDFVCIFIFIRIVLLNEGKKKVSAKILESMCLFSYGTGDVNYPSLFSIASGKFLLLSLLTI